ncbi:Major facilitator superfamily domain, general substrate transporter [Niveomyces insectorum RCEF 264]|uniref:Major facilitator superfamily domain, general substrate transporter n=1 Tax=Niveomyces insectorum RCEF 264 TaxID=1081102 RepID=A0A167WA36_9HYPO|nr:Major facilitator superfamily domain, general substrate transporter [Niveomyces insectorum RCEF 264]
MAILANEAGEGHHAHLAHSHAHEEDIPGTVNLVAAEGDDTGYGQALFPVPAQDPNDPLQWPASKKNAILIIVSVYSFLGNATLTGINVYIPLYTELFGVSPTAASTLISYPNLCFGFSSLLLVPLYLKFGRRPVMLGTLLCFIAGLIGAARANTFGGLMAARCVHAFGAGVCEALPVQLVNDIFYIHERGKRIGYYTVALCLAAVSPLAAGYMLDGGYSWRLFFYVSFALAGAVFVLAFFFVEESSYDRTAALAAEAATMTRTGSVPAAEDDNHDATGEKNAAATTTTTTEHEHGPATSLPPSASSSVLAAAALPPRKRFVQTLSLAGRRDRGVSMVGTVLRAVTYFLVPQALWVITTYGANIGLGALGMGYTFPGLITAPPYNWSLASAGLQSLAPFVGFLAAVPFMAASDRLAAYRTRRNGGVREAEMRLGVLLVPMLVGPAGLLLYGLAAQARAAWACYLVGSALLSWSGFFYFSLTLTYAVDAHYANTSEMIIAVNVGKQAVSFGFGNAVLTWVHTRSYAVIFGGVFTGVLAANNLVVLVFLFWGKPLRRAMARSWLARLHRQTHTAGAAH